VLIYAGHNEYYGVLGAASARGGPLAPYLVRATLALQRLRLGLALRALLEREGGAATDSAPSFMELLARDREVPLSSITFARGEAQFVDNLSALLATIRARGIPVFVGRPVSNVRDRPPFASPDNEAADSVFRDGLAALARADSARARDALPLARDLDVVRFRAPSRFVGIVQEAAAVGGAAYVPVAERFEAASAGLPGASLFLEHVHPTRAGVTVLARTFYDALAEARFL
jgi:lysophospholipase L1-like esterase